MYFRGQSLVMCWRFTLFEADTILSKDFGARISFVSAPRYNIAPTQQILAVRLPTGKEVRKAAVLR
jgi:putative SOS response-associated peptidase YedK